MTMSRATGLISCSVILSLVVIHGIFADESPGSRSVQAAKQDNIMSREEELRSLLPNLLDRDDYHSNIELDKINEALRYETSPSEGSSSSGAGLMQPAGHHQIHSNLDDWLGRMINRNRVYLRGGPFYYGKRAATKPVFDVAKEDKDYSFVGINPANKQTTSTNQDFALQASIWASELLRDLIKSRGRQELQQPHSKPYSLNYPQLSQASSWPTNDAIPVTTNDIAPSPSTNREKRRRCKVDPNLGVKNPSFCDTDAYFGAADYSMRDVWDSAGR